MAFIISNVTVTMMAVTFFLLAIQAEPFTAVLGFLFGAILSLAVIRQTIISAKGNDAGRFDTSND